MAPRKMKLQEKDMKMSVQFKGVKPKMGKRKDLRKEQRETRVKFGEMERQCDGLREETEMMIRETGRTRMKIALMFNILKAREGGDLIEAAQLTMFLREIVGKERARGISNGVKK